MEYNQKPSISKASERKKEEVGLFKPAVIKKTSGLLALFLLLSILTPVLAFAGAWFKDVTYKNGTVSGVVYTDTYDPDVSVAVYNAFGGAFISAADVTYDASISNDGFWYYNFSKNIGTRYDRLHVVATVYGVTHDTYVNKSYDFIGGGGGGGGISNGDTANIGSDGRVSASWLQNALKNNDNVTLKLSGEFVIIPASALLEANGKTITIIASNNATYVYPINVDLINDWAKQLGVEAKDMDIRITIAKVTGDDLAAVEKAAEDLGANLLADPIDYTVAVEANGQSIEVDDMGQYVTRTLPMSGSFDPSKTTGVVYNPETGEFSFVPSFTTTKDDESTLTVKRRSNSIYTAIEYSKTFADIAGHWAQSYIEDLAGKLIVNGVNDTSFQPERNITRAEFAALVVRALGLNANVEGSSFSDVQANAWYAGVVNAAVKAGLVKGYEDGTFRPNNPINREELAALVVRALNYAGKNTTVSADEQAQLLAKYQDAGSIVWAKAEIAAAIKSGIVEGMTATTIAPRNDATRAQSATMLQRFLSAADFINK